jgi:rod shape determining protein RodA
LKKRDNIWAGIDWLTLGLYAFFVLFGWLNIFAVVYDPEVEKSIFDFGNDAGKQLVWIGTSILLVIIILSMDYKFFYGVSTYFYLGMLAILLITTFFGKEVNGSHSWLEIGAVRVQPAEFAKLATALMLARFLDAPGVRLDRLDTRLLVLVIIAVPCAFILLQNETGSVLVFAAFTLMLYREGMPGFILFTGFICAILFVATLMAPLNIIIGIILSGLILIGGWALYRFFRAKSTILKRNYLRFTFVSLMVAAACVIQVLSVNYIFTKVLQEHQRNRIMVLIDPELDLRKLGYQVRQSKIAIGSGNFFGKGYLNGTQTKFNFVPFQETDFIFCTIGEEHGWLGSTLIVGLYLFFLSRLIFLAERQKDTFARTYGYSVASLMFFHFVVNIGMTLGLVPVIGIPLPFFSYGGSSLWSFTLMLFIFLKVDAHRGEVLKH